MDIKDIRQKKVRLEKDITNLVNVFEKETDCYISGISVETEAASYGDMSPDELLTMAQVEIKL